MWRSSLEPDQQYLLMRGMSDRITTKGENRDFRFGDGVVVRSKVVVKIPVCLAKAWRELTLHVLPGSTPLLLARPDLERWKVVVDYGKKLVLVDGVEVKPTFTANGHYMVNIYGDLQDILNVEEFVKAERGIEEEEATSSRPHCLAFGLAKSSKQTWSWSIPADPPP